MILTVYGNNATCPEADGACSCFLIECDNKKVLLDMGNGSLAKLQKDVDISDLDAIIISHLHFDHFGDLFCAKYQLETRMANGEKLATIPLFAPTLPAWAEAALLDNNVFSYRNISNEREFSLGDIHVEAFQMVHLIESYGIRITSNGKIFAYTGDSGVCAQLAELAKDADVLLCEATFPERMHAEESHHLSAKSAGRCASINRVGKLLLTHFHGNQASEILEEALIEFQNSELTEIGRKYTI